MLHYFAGLAETTAYIRDRLAKIPHLKNSRGSDRDNMKKAMLYKVKLEIKLCRIFGS
ncbi:MULTISPECIES: hypothetical protein [Cyanophyceae]|uniref:Mobile element protein n=1 Tax=Phormidium tenue FACHB-1050 TaxID=2692857 RepID=A0ABR8C808_9CYAN|nr:MULTISPECIES: hypothetical protein [Cyanophyceae]MBD2316809.1 hypothetical protein [Phormidium tenue FACHB-1050]